jgi:hypothetical protein
LAEAREDVEDFGRGGLWAWEARLVCDWDRVYRDTERRGGGRGGGETHQTGGRQGAVDVEQHDGVLDLALGERRVGGHGCGGGNSARGSRVGVLKLKLKN